MTIRVVPSGPGRTFEYDPATAALVLIDMQRDFIESGGACGVLGANVKPLQAIIPAAQRALDFAREQGMCVVHTRYGFKRDLSNLSESVRRQSKAAGGEYGTPGPLGLMYVEGEAGFEIIPELTPAAGEIIINKPTFGAFSGSNLNKILRERGITHLVFGGVTTQCCVESSIREAVDLGYYVLTLSDCCAAFEEPLHEATMKAIASEGFLFGWIATCNDFVGQLRAVA